METLDWIVLGGYFVLIALIGVLSMLRIKDEEDFFMGGRSFGKLLQTFAAFGAGTGSNDPVNVGRTTWTSGLSGIWSVLMWLFVTPFYWIFGVWYRRMRHLTIGDYFTERYESKTLGAAYCLFGIYFYAMYFSAMFTAITKVAAPMFGSDTVNLFGNTVELQYVLVPAIAVCVVFYGILGGLKAAYWTDLVQGLGIITLSIILIPYGLDALVKQFDPQGPHTMMRGMEIMHERMPASYFKIFGGPRSGEFPLHYILSLTLLGLIGIVVQPHFISTGGGSARTENSARIGLVTGNFLKRFCTIGWALTGLIILTLYAGNADLAGDPDKVWGVATIQILGPLKLGLVGLMLACLLAAAMSSADCYMVMVAGLVTRNIYAPLKPNASEKTYLLVGRLSGMIMIISAAIVSLVYQDVFKQFVDAITTCVIFAAVFWLGMWWRRANRWSAWLTVLATFVFFFVMPMIPSISEDMTPSFMNDARFAVKNHVVTTTVTRPATQVDIGRWQAYEQRRAAAEAIENDDERAKAMNKLGDAPAEATDVGQEIKERFKSGGKPIYWSKLDPVDGPEPYLETVSETTSEDGKTSVLTQKWVGQFVGSGKFNMEYLFYGLLNVDLQEQSDAMLKTLTLPAKLVTPFLFMIVISFITPRNRKEALDRFYTKMKVPVIPDHGQDAAQLEQAYADPQQYEHRKLLPGTSIEIQKPRLSDVIGFFGAFVICFAIVWFAVWLMNLGAPAG